MDVLLYIILFAVFVFIVTIFFTVRKDNKKSGQVVAEKRRKFTVVGVSFKNDDGTRRQTILQKINDGKEPFGNPTITLERYKYEGEDAVGVYSDDTQVGNLSRSDAAYLCQQWDNVGDVEDFEVYGGDDGKYFGMAIYVSIG